MCPSVGEELGDLDHAGGAQHLEHVARRHAVVDHPRGARVGSWLENRNATRLNARFFCYYLHRNFLGSLRTSQHDQSLLQER